VRLDPRNFSRKATGTPGLLEETGLYTSGGAGRPAALYRAAAEASPAGRDAGAEDGPAAARAVIDPPLLRPRA
jgi:8-oxo-dGTP diphosphatase